MLKLKFLGQLKMEYDGKDLTSQVSGKSMALLAILLVQRNHQASRRQLINYLWPDSGQEAGRYNLRYNLWQLKKLIPPESSGEHFLMITKDTCRINERFTYTSDLGRILSAQVENTDDLAELEELYSQFTGDFFGEQTFHGCDEFEEMVVMQRYCLEHKKLQLLKKLVLLYHERGEHEKCLQALNDCETLDPYDETNAEIRIRIFTAMGSFGEAVKFYQKFYHKLARDIGAEPSEKLKQLIGKVRNRNTAAVQDDPENPSAYLDTRSHISLSVTALSQVESYLLADIAGNLQQCGRIQISSYLEPGQLADLAFIQPLCGKPAENVPMVRVIQAFITLISSLCSDGFTLELSINGSPDALSAEVLHLLQTRCGQNLVLKQMQEDEAGQVPSSEMECFKLK